MHILYRFAGQVFLMVLAGNGNSTEGATDWIEYIEAAQAVKPQRLLRVKAEISDAGGGVG